MAYATQTGSNRETLLLETSLRDEHRLPIGVWVLHSVRLTRSRRWRIPQKCTCARQTKP
ncbi:MAG: hypothetical protein ACI82G_003381 [Bradymonadia bacterium]|jgi:hypothetical protein